MRRCPRRPLSKRSFLESPHSRAAPFHLSVWATVLESRPRWEGIALLFLSVSVLSRLYHAKHRKHTTYNLFFHGDIAYSGPRLRLYMPLIVGLQPTRFSQAINNWGERIHSHQVSARVLRRSGHCQPSILDRPALAVPVAGILTNKDRLPSVDLRARRHRYSLCRLQLCI